MKKQFSYSIFAAFVILPCLIFGQGGSPGNTRFGPANFLGYATTAGTAGSLDIRNDWNQQILFGTNGFSRMLIDNGGGLQNGGRIAIGNNLPPGFNPSARLHIHQIAVTTNSITPFIRFTTPVTGTTNTDGFAIGNTTQATVGNNGEVHLIQYEQEPIIISAPNTNTNYLGPQPAEVFRIQNGKMVGLPISAAFRSSDGYVGLNQTNPRAHIEMVTTAFTGGEEFFMAKPSDLPGADVQMGMMNLTSVDNFFLPGLFGNVNQPNQSGTALSMIGCIPTAHDLAGDPPVMRFAVGKNWIINQNTPLPVGNLPVTNSVVTRPLFSWENSGGIYMFMAANGRLRIGYNSILSNPNLIPQRPNNRIEITADVIDPYFNPNGNPAGNPIYAGITSGSASGLRFTYLTSHDLVIAPDATNQIDPSKVLSVDKNGDVVAIYPALGAICTNTAQIVAQTFSASRAINQGTFNMEWRGQGRNGFGTSSCTVGNRVEITGLTSFSATPGGNSGLRFTNLTSTNTAITNPTTKILSVNSNGDVILVTDQTGTVVGSGSITAQNGLSILSTNTVELGGTLLHNTNIDFVGKELLYYDGLANLHYQRAASGARWQHAVGVNSKDNQACFSDVAIINSGVPVGY